MKRIKIIVIIVLHSSFGMLTPSPQPPPPTTSPQDKDQHTIDDECYCVKLKLHYYAHNSMDHGCVSKEPLCMLYFYFD